MDTPPTATSSFAVPVSVCATPPTTTSASIVTVPVIQQQEGIYAYISIRGILSGDDCTVFGINLEEKLALQKRFTFSSIEICHGAVIKSNVFQVMNSLSKLGYKVVCSSGEKDTTWTMQREI